jgi:hypothetical protein
MWKSAVYLLMFISQYINLNCYSTWIDEEFYNRILESVQRFSLNSASKSLVIFDTDGANFGKNNVALYRSKNGHRRLYTSDVRTNVPTTLRTRYILVNQKIHLEKRVVKVVQWSYRTKPNYNIPTTLRLRCETCMKIQSITRLIYDDRGPKYFKNWARFKRKNSLRWYAARQSKTYLRNVLWL